ncbi:MAG: hypothetical protein ACRCUY_04635 [Thermoguttaceae bacterium]
MAIHVICPGCMKRFQVSDRFAGQTGPCPNCNSVITIPKASVTIHGGEEFASGGKTSSGKLLLKPISRLNVDFDPVRAGWYTLATLVFLLLTYFVGTFSMSLAIRDTIGVIGVILVAFPLSFFGYFVMREVETLFIPTGMDLYQLIGRCAIAYVAIWILFETFAWYMSANFISIWIFLGIFVIFASLASHALLDIEFDKAFFHALIFFFALIILRAAFGLGWIGDVELRTSKAPDLPSSQMQMMKRR